MTRLKIVHTESSCGWGGQELRIIAESQGMMSRGHEVCIVAPPESRIFSEARRRGIPAHTAPITPNVDFYCVTKDLIDPSVSTSVWRLRIGGLVERPRSYGFDDVPSVMDGWMRSPGHRRNILGKYEEIGVGRAIARDGASYWCVTFGTPSGR